MRIALTVLLALFYCIPSAHAGNPFLHLKFDKVVFYDIDIPGEKPALIADSNGKLLVPVLKQIQLDKATVKELNAKIGSKQSYGNVRADCFTPHCGLVYYLDDKPVAQVLICLDCNKLGASIPVPAQRQGEQERGKWLYYTRDGMSKPFRQFINQLLVNYHFSHQVAPGSDFDK